MEFGDLQLVTYCLSNRMHREVFHVFATTYRKVWSKVSMTAIKVINNSYTFNPIIQRLIAALFEAL